MQKLRIVNSLIYLFVVGPIWFYLQYKLLQAIQASELMWFLFWVYVPTGMLTTFLLKITSEKD
jgi:hypothetical protein